MKISLKQLSVVVFVEKHVINSSQESGFILDIELVEIEGKDFNRLYCGHLLLKLLNLEKPLLQPFLEYQCKLKVDPLHWLSSLETLLNRNGQLLIQNGCWKQMNDLFALLDEQRKALELSQLEKSTIQLVDAAEELEIKSAEPETFAKEIRTLPWNGPTNILADMFYQATQIKGDDGKPLIPANINEISEFIERHFHRVDGKALNQLTLKTYLSPSRPDKRPSKGKGIQIKKSSKNKELE